MTHRNAQAGFTMIEMMFAVAIVTALGAVVVPSFVRATRKTKASTEVSAMFAELGSKEDQYHLNTDKYLAAAACPAAVPTSGYTFETSCATSGSPWLSLAVRPPTKTLRCQYTITMGAAGTALTPPAGFTIAGKTTITPAVPWYYIVATCDEDGRGGVDASFFTSNIEVARIQSQNVGS